MAIARIEQPITGINGVELIDAQAPPYTVLVAVEGEADLLFHRWSNDDVEAKGAAAKGSKIKKIDNIEVYLYRNDEGQICVPGRYLQRAIIEAARFHQDPRSPRKSAMDLVKAGAIVTPLLAPVLVEGKPVEAWDYLDRQRVTVQRAAITRTRPAFRAGWQARLEVTSLLPDYITTGFLHRMVEDAGRFIGLGDFRPTYGRFRVISWQLMGD